MTFSQHQIPASPCPTCGVNMDGATNTDSDRAPKPGDITVCAYCVTILRYGEGLRLEALTPEGKRQVLLETPKLRDLIAALTIRQTIRRSP